MKSILVKRLESSFYAFRMTLQRFIKSYDDFIKMAKTGTVYISKKIDVYDLLDDGNLDKLLYYIEQQDVMKFKTTDFEPRFMRELEHDLSSLKSLQDMWDLIEGDPKLDEFKKEGRIIKQYLPVIYKKQGDKYILSARALDQIPDDAEELLRAQSESTPP